jgi:hypothetical protein
MPSIPFTGNYQDLSSNRGFQFKFFCEKCGNGYMSTFKASKLGMAASAASAAAGLLGGIFGRAAMGAQQLESLVGGPVHDAALKEAVDEIRPQFKQCTRCGNWVCEPVCWNKKAQLCEGCAPDLDEEIAAAQAQAARDQAMEKAKDVNWLASRNIAQATAAQCPKCQAKTGGAKFCPECGEPLVAPKRTCAACGHEAEGAPKFCPECGKPYAT